MSAQWERFSRHARNGWKAAVNHQGQRRAIARRYAFDIARTVAPAIVATDGEIQFLVATQDRGVGRATFSNGAYEIDVMRKGLALVEREIGRDPIKGRVFIDVGANIGTTSVPAVKIMGASRTLSIEPDPRNFRLLRCNVILNALEDRVTCINAAVTTERKSVELELSSLNFGDHRVRVGGNVPDGAYHESGRNTTSVDAYPLDDLLLREQVRPSDVGLLWVDTQGHEGHVLASAGQILSAGVPAIVEYWPYGLNRSGGGDLLYRTISKYFTVAIDVRTGQRLPADKVADLGCVYQGIRGYTDLALI